jgi:hypothetical protein
VKQTRTASSDSAQPGQLACIVSHDGHAYAVDLEGGRFCARWQLPAASSTPLLLVPRGGGGFWGLCATMAGHLAVLEAPPKLPASTLLPARVLLQLPSPVFSTPVLLPAGGFLVGCRDDHLYCII